MTTRSRACTGLGSPKSCDWGYDLSDGPEALLPGLAPAKRLARLARLRATVDLDANRFDAALDDLQSAFVLGRNLSRDHILISALVQMAMESILSSVVMENYYRLNADELDEIAAAFASAPSRGTLADTIPMGGPFEFGRATFEGQDRGFQLKSKEPFRDFPEVMIFLEKPGKPFRLDGKNAGTAR